jgi:hypothetical protein
MMPIGMSKRTRAWSQRERFVSPGGLYLRRRQHAATFGYFGPAQDSEQKLANDLQFAWKSGPPGTAPLSAAIG